MRIVMPNRPYRTIIGLMSGTSLDGIDAAVVRVQGSGTGTEVELLAFHGIEYDAELRDRMKRLCGKEHSHAADLCMMNAYLGQRFAEAAREAAAAAGIPMEDIDLVSSHGQTVWHQPEADSEDRYSVPSTLQIGDLSVIAKLTGRPVVGDYRPADMAVGGQGAPLTPYADYIFHRHERMGRIAQNIGGIGNCTVVPAGAEAEQVLAFDTGPGNMLIDQAVYRLWEGAPAYDRDGGWAAQGQVSEAWLSELLEHPYYAQKPRKTTGREMFGEAYAMALIQDGLARGLPAADIVATFTMLTVRTIASAYRDFIFPEHDIHEVIVSGGGARNETMMRWLAAELPEQRVQRSDEAGLPGDAKEAIAFAVLANEFVHGIANQLPSVTGASRPTVMGKLALP
ncbi:anhydro-N-acetylmuramic acid kinase [Paenibacillus thiaminolyticus]|nr:anhydro-N-acetylmuramic acid kinase [Paenibacillus thiaminolyticus]